VYGDPALLFPQYYQPRVERPYELGIIPHYIDRASPCLAAYEADDRVRLIDVTQRNRENKVFSFIDEVCQCQRIASSSLHGLILADAYEIPSLWIEFSGNVYGGGFKFRDYFLSVNREPMDPVPARHTPVATDDLIRLIDRRPYRIRFSSDRLLARFPG
jgi:pyruvyltransferase